MDTNISHYLLDDGSIDATAIESLRQIVDKYPYYHAARIMLVRLLFQQHDSSYSSELSRAVLYLPSRDAVFQIVEENQFKPKKEKDPILSGATVSRKAVSKLAFEGVTAAQRTEKLIAGFLDNLPGNGEQMTSSQKRRVFPIDASQDYMGFMLQQEESQRLQAAQEAARQSKLQAPSPKPTNRSDDLLDTFINDTGDKRIKLRNTEEGDLQKPAPVSELLPSQGTFTEALARIYIKQGKFDHAIEIIRRLSLKYPKKNSYFADQIRFLEKLMENQRFSK